LTGLAVISDKEEVALDTAKLQDILARYELTAK